MHSPNDLAVAIVKAAIISVRRRCAAGSRTAVIEMMTRRGVNNRTVEGTIVSWSDTKIEADLGSICPDQVTATSLFGSATSEVKATNRQKTQQVICATAVE